MKLSNEQLPWAPFSLSEQLFQTSPILDPPQEKTGFLRPVPTHKHQTHETADEKF